VALPKITPGLVFSAKAGFHLSPNAEWVPAIAGTTLIRSGSSAPEDHGNSSESLTQGVFQQVTGALSRKFVQEFSPRWRAA